MAEPSTRKSMPWWAGVAVAMGAAVAGFAAVYVTLGRSDNGRTPGAEVKTAEQPAGVVQSGPANGLNRGQMASFIFRKEREVLPDVKFQNGRGQELALADLRGKVVLLNLWATWCLPCRKEMPALDRLQGELGSDRFQVVAISVDRTGVAGARKFLDETKAAKLTLYADPTAKLAAQLKAAGLPATLLIDAQGREVGRLLGPAEWDGEDAKRLIASVVK